MCCPLLETSQLCRLYPWIFANIVIGEKPCPAGAKGTHHWPPLPFEVAVLHPGGLNNSRFSLQIRRGFHVPLP